MAKYELTNMSVECEGRVLYRIRAVSNFGQIKRGTVGGFVESEYNLSQCGKCWIYDGASVYGNARITDNATVRDNAIVKDFAIVSGTSDISDDAVVLGNSRVKDNATVMDRAIISGDAIISKDAFVGDVALIGGNAKIGKHAFIRKRDDYVLLEHVMPNNQLVTIYHGFAGSLLVHAGKYRGTIEEFWKQIKNSDDYTRKTKRICKRILKSIKTTMLQSI